RDIDNRALGGVCAGIAAYLNLDTVWVRIVFALLPFLSFGAIVPIYIVLWIAVPPALTTTQKMQMKGENITIGNIEKSIKEEFEKVKEQFSKTGEKYSRRDKNILTIVAVVVGLLLLTRMFGWSTSFVHPMNFHFPFAFPFAGGLFPLIILLLLLGLIFRPALKGFLIAIVVLIIVSILINLFSGMLFFTPWFMI
ncbi:MAG TPA: PspC domain-containing protein, partial [Marinilabiliaceae bacterium]|nr:PspC domain-containing protein [Marinilabiliaceae bacterium]